MIHITIGFYMAKLDEIGYQVCFRMSRVTWSMCEACPLAESPFREEFTLSTRPDQTRVQLCTISRFPPCVFYISFDIYLINVQWLASWYILFQSSLAFLWYHCCGHRQNILGQNILAKVLFDWWASRHLLLRAERILQFSFAEFRMK